MKTPYCAGLALFLLPASVWATVTVSNPFNGETVSTSANYVATATTTTCAKGVASMGVYVDGVLGNVVNGNKLNTTVSLTLGSHNTVVQEWDYCGGSTYTPISVIVATQNAVWVTSPVPNSTVNLLANYVATATSTCSKGVASMGIYINNSLVYTAPGAKLNTQITLRPGAQHTVVEEWDYCGGATYSTVNLTVTNTGNKLANLQSNAGWQSWGQLPPIYADCSPCTGLNWSLLHGVTSPSLSRNATQFNTSGTTSYGAVLWYNPVIGDFSTQGLPDVTHTLVPSLHNFIYDTDFYVTNAAVSQALEFDVSMYMNGVGMFFGTQCNHLGGGEWDVLNNVTQQWATAGVPCNVTNGWNHLILQFQRESDNSLLYQSITLNGVTYNINKTYAPFQVPVSWYGITVNYQMDGNYKQSSNSTYLDNLSVTYW
jgi:hypothetical protein